MNGKRARKLRTLHGVAHVHLLPVNAIKRGPVLIQTRKGPMLISLTTDLPVRSNRIAPSLRRYCSWLTGGYR